MARLKEYYSKEVAPALMSKFSYKSTMQIPKLDKIVININITKEMLFIYFSALAFPKKICNIDFRILPPSKG